MKIEERGGGVLFTPRERQNFIAPDGYSKKLSNRVKSIFDGTPLTLVNGAESARNINASLMYPHLPAYPDGLGDLDRAAYNVKFPAALEAMLCATAESRQNGYTEALGAHDVHHLPRVASMMAVNGDASDVAMRVVYGASEQMPLRAVGYVLPSLLMMEQLTKQGITPPQLQLVHARNISGGLSGKDPERAATQARTVGQITRAYVNTFFPDLADSVVLLEDSSLDDNPDIMAEIQDVAAIVRAQTPEELAQKLEQKDSKHGNGSNHFLYTSAHLYIHDKRRPSGLCPMFTDQADQNDPSCVISMGGKQERLFYTLRHLVKTALPGEYSAVPTLQYFTNFYTPPYLMARDCADLALDTVLKTGTVPFGSLSGTAHYDIAFMNGVERSGTNLVGFVEQYVTAT